MGVFSQKYKYPIWHITSLRRCPQSTCNCIVCPHTGGRMKVWESGPNYKLPLTFFIGAKTVDYSWWSMMLNGPEFIRWDYIERQFNRQFGTNARTCILHSELLLRFLWRKHNVKIEPETTKDNVMTIWLHRKWAN